VLTASQILELKIEIDYSTYRARAVPPPGLGALTLTFA